MKIVLLLITFLIVSHASENKKLRMFSAEKNKYDYVNFFKYQTVMLPNVCRNSSDASL